MFQAIAQYWSAHLSIQRLLESTVYAFQTCSQQYSLNFMCLCYFYCEYFVSLFVRISRCNRFEITFESHSLHRIFQSKFVNINALDYVLQNHIFYSTVVPAARLLIIKRPLYILKITWYAAKCIYCNHISSSSYSNPENK